MTIKLSSAQVYWLRKIRGGANSSPPAPASVVKALENKGLIREYRDRFGAVRYSLTDAAWKFF